MKTTETTEIRIEKEGYIKKLPDDFSFISPTLDDKVDRSDLYKLINACERLSKIKSRQIWRMHHKPKTRKRHK